MTTKLPDVWVSRHGGEPVALLAELDEARARIAELEAALAAERERREAAETDAGRYRWLREWRARWEIRYWGGMFWDSFNADKLDAAIDKEAAKSPGTEPMQSKLVED